ncbi:MAG: putative toxin-antitoxin system toxin component, PIN family [Rhizobiales bacterium 65-79]|nr:putative toxin-antitoxin system toxin component, PIN family [Hyphomicrobiales bacterium]OJU00743.1 MAG: putative toxin-antitoxin system toxin component, PIN family [Rhizobiales bacterium 65-79]
MRLVLDTSIIVSGLRSPGGASAELLRRLRFGQGQLLLSVPLLLEYEAVCCRPEHLEASELTGKEVNQVLDVLVAISEPVEIKFLWRPQLRDAADEMVLETAINGRADAIVTFNERDFRPVPGLFGVSILQPKKVIDRIIL